jgi:nicotinate-nucleotide adenylyltransferase
MEETERQETMDALRKENAFAGRKLRELADLSAYEGRSLALYGGTWDPIHRGHLEIAREAAQEMGWERLVLMVAGTPPHKRGREMTSASDRLMMTRIAADPYPELSVSDWEVRRDSYAYTAETLELLKKEFGIREICFLIGGDSLMYLDEWYHAERIMAEGRIFVAARAGSATRRQMQAKARNLRKKYGADITLLKADGPDLSATEIREKLNRREWPEGDLSEDLREYMIQNHLYGWAVNADA